MVVTMSIAKNVFFNLRKAFPNTSVSPALRYSTSISRVSFTIPASKHSSSGGSAAEGNRNSKQWRDFHSNGDKDVTDKAKEKMSRASDKAEETKEKGKEKGKEMGKEAREKAEDVTESGKEKVKEGAEEAKEEAQNMGEKAKKKVEEAWGAAKETTQKIKETVIGSKEEIEDDEFNVESPTGKTGLKEGEKDVVEQWRRVGKTDHHEDR